MNYPIADEPIDAKKVNEALSKYIDKYGPPPPMTESIEIEVSGRVVVIQLFSVKETE